VSSDFNVSQAFAAVSPVSGVARWRVLKLAESVEQGVWQQNTSPTRVVSAEQDTNGWITLDVNNPSPAVTYPEDFAFLTWRPRDAFGREVDPGMFGGGGTGILQVLLERDTAVWTGGADETVSVGVVDRDGDLGHASAEILGIGLRTPSAATTQTIIAGIRGSANSNTGVTLRWLAGSYLILPTQFINVSCGALNASRVAVSGAHKDNIPVSCTGERRLWVGFGAATSANAGSLPVKFRVYYRILPAAGLP
jgi:hypothetical protein